MCGGVEEEQLQEGAEALGPFASKQEEGPRVWINDAAERRK